jgi:hypothetical protein
VEDPPSEIIGAPIGNETVHLLLWLAHLAPDLFRQLRRDLLIGIDKQDPRVKGEARRILVLLLMSRPSLLEELVRKFPADLRSPVCAERVYDDDLIGPPDTPERPFNFSVIKVIIHGDL